MQLVTIYNHKELNMKTLDPEENLEVLGDKFWVEIGQGWRSGLRIEEPE